MIKKTFFSLLLVFKAYGFKLIPMTSSIYPSENRTTIFKVKNDQKKSMAIEASIAKRVMGEDGKEKHPEVDDFLIYPPQFVLKPGETQSLKVKWISKDIPAIEEAYRVIVSQVPVEVDEKELKENKTNIKILLKYIGALYVSDKKHSSKIIVSSSKVKDGQLFLRLENQGNKHQVLRALKLIVSQKGKTLELSGTQLKNVDSENVLAKQSRNFNIPLPKKNSFSNGQVKVEISFK